MKNAAFAGFMLSALISICFAADDNLNSNSSQESKERQRFLLMGGLEDPLLECFINNYRDINTYQAVWSIEFNSDDSKFKGIGKCRNLIDVAFDRKTNSLSYLTWNQKLLNDEWVDFALPGGGKMLVVYNEAKLSVQTDLRTETQFAEKLYDGPDEFTYRDFRRATWVCPIPFDMPLLASPAPIMEMLQDQPEKLEIVKLPADTVSTPHISEKRKAGRDDRELAADSDLQITIFPKYGETAVRLIIDGKDGLLNEFCYFRGDKEKDDDLRTLKLQSVKINTPLDRSIFDFDTQKQKMFPPAAKSPKK